MRLDFHWVDPIIRPSCSDELNLLEVAAGPASGEARPRRGLRDDVIVGVCGHRQARRIEGLRAVFVEHPEPDREELHDLARIVLVGHRPRALGGERLVLKEGEVVRHGRRVRGLAQHVAVRAEGVAHKDVVEVDPGLGIPVPEAVAALANHDDLRERPRDTLAQLVGCGQREHRVHILLLRITTTIPPVEHLDLRVEIGRGFVELHVAKVIGLAELGISGHLARRAAGFDAREARVELRPDAQRKRERPRAQLPRQRIPFNRVAEPADVLVDTAPAVDPPSIAVGRWIPKDHLAILGEALDRVKLHSLNVSWVI